MKTLSRRKHKILCGSWNVGVGQLKPPYKYTVFQRRVEKLKKETGFRMMLCSIPKQAKPHKKVKGSEYTSELIVGGFTCQEIPEKPGWCELTYIAKVKGRKQHWTSYWDSIWLGNSTRRAEVLISMK